MNATDVQPDRATTQRSCAVALVPVRHASQKQYEASNFQFLKHAIAVTLIVAATAFVNAWHVEGALGWSDGPNHLFDGIFLYEFARELPLSDPRGWAEQFYLRFPTLGIIVYWPPGFAAVEALVFAVFGVSLLAARLLVLTFVVGTGLALYGLGRQLFRNNSGLIAALILIVTPAGARWAGDVMLEWPATFWMTLAVVTYLRGLRVDRARWPIAMFALSVVMAFFTKQTAGIILPVILLHAALHRDGRRWLFRPLTVWVGVLIAAVVLSYAKLAAPYTALPSQLLAMTPDGVFYFSHLPETVGWPVLGMIVVGLLALPLAIRRSHACFEQPIRTFASTDHTQQDIVDNMREAAGGLTGINVDDGKSTDRRSSDVTVPECAKSAPFKQATVAMPLLLLTIWLLAWWGFSSLIAAKEPRYFFFALPPLLLLSVQSFLTLGIWFQTRAKINSERVDERYGTPKRATVIVLTLVLCSQAIITLWYHPGTPPSYQPAVEMLVQRGNADLVLVDAVRDGQFVFDVYRNDAARSRLIPLRTSKLLYARAARMKYAGVELVESKDDIVALLNELGIRYIVMESQLPATHYVDADPPPRKLLRELVTTDVRFQRRDAWPLACDDAAWNDVDLWLIEYTACPPRTQRVVEIPIPAMGRTVELRLPD